MKQSIHVYRSPIAVIAAAILLISVSALQSPELRAAEPADDLSSRITVSRSAEGQKKPLFYTAQIVRSWPHDKEAFTQGLFFDGGFIYEGTGLAGRSELRRIDLHTGRVVQRHRLPAALFGEGIVMWKDTIFQLTWRSGAALVYDRRGLNLKGAFAYEGEGWGITRDSSHLVMSNGTSSLIFRDPVTFKITGTVTARDGAARVTQLNELEYINGMIYANVWHTDRIAVIDPVSGVVRAWVDLSDIVKRAGGDSRIKTLNGIAWDGEGHRLFVTGKFWPELYEISLVPVNDPV